MHSPRNGGPGKDHGFSMVELLVTLAVAGVLLASAAPKFIDLVHDHRLSTQINLLLTDVHLARIEAIKRNHEVVICRSIDGRHCDIGGGSQSDWSAGRIIYVNLDGDKTRDPGEPLLQARAVLPSRLNLRFNQWWRVTFHPDGSASNGSFALCDFRGSEHARALILYYTGRPRVADRRADGDPIDCGETAG
ncbi:MAG: GspH/FimT family pseudopilin [Gammaproteobacteria bacterium]|nr:GspH/FimT family pseudopilin [Gammaproteobacteria bacterium]